jgi:hypothetical protein
MARRSEIDTYEKHLAPTKFLRHLPFLPQYHRNEYG